MKLAGYLPDNWPVLEKDLLLLVEHEEAVFEEKSIYGALYSITGKLNGPNSRQLAVKTIWMEEYKTGLTKFVTLYPAKKN